MDLEKISNPRVLRAIAKVTAERNRRLIKNRDNLRRLLNEVADHIDHDSLSADALADLYARITNLAPLENEQ